MKTTNLFNLAIFCFAIMIGTIGCKNQAAETPAATEETATMEAKPDMAKVKAEIQALETAWATADDARDVEALAAFYADDAVTFSNNEPMISGKEAIKKDIAESMSKRVKGEKVMYDVMDVYGNEDVVTETGKITRKDASGKVTYTGKYMAIWEKRDGKYVCVRDISNDDAKSK